jgi:RND family efflux transporter MFP subunit
MKLTKRSTGIGVVALVVVALAAAFAVRAAGGDAGDDAESALLSDFDFASSDAFSTDMPIPVEGAVVIEDTLVLAVRAAGEAAAWRRTVVRAQVAGRVDAVPARENAFLGAGGALVLIDPEEHQLALDEARARLAQAEAQYREMTLFDARIADDSLRRERAAWSRARTGIEAAEVAVRRAEINLARTRVASPFAGVVANLMVVPGQHVNVGDELITIQEVDPIRVEVQVLESEGVWGGHRGQQ